MFESHKGDKIQTEVEDLETFVMTQIPTSVCEALSRQLEQRLQGKSQVGELINLIQYFESLKTLAKAGHKFAKSYEAFREAKPGEFSEHIKKIRACLNVYGCELDHKAL